MMTYWLQQETAPGRWIDSEQCDDRNQAIEVCSAAEFNAGKDGPWRAVERLDLEGGSGLMDTVIWPPPEGHPKYKMQGIMPFKWIDPPGEWRPVGER